MHFLNNNLFLNKFQNSFLSIEKNRSTIMNSKDQDNHNCNLLPKGNEASIGKLNSIDQTDKNSLRDFKYLEVSSQTSTKISTSPASIYDLRNDCETKVAYMNQISSASLDEIPPNVFEYSGDEEEDESEQQAERQVLEEGHSNQNTQPNGSPSSQFLHLFCIRR
jgi:hypothetical protein